MIPQNFIWSDGPRPSESGITDYLDLSSRLNIDFEILQLQDPDNDQRWRDDILLEVCHGLRSRGIRVHWMLWARTDEGVCHQQLSYLERLYLEFIPNGVQWDAEEQFRAEGPFEACADILDEGLRHLNEVYSCAPEYSITATTDYPRPQFLPHIEYLLSRGSFTAGYAMAYAFYNPQEGHWSQDLPLDVTRTVRIIAEAWIDAVRRGVLGTCYLGLAAHFQNFPPKYGLTGLEGMTQCVGEVYQLSDENPNHIRGQGWWSRKHVDQGEEGKQTIIYNASQDPRGGRDLTPLPDPPHNPVYDLQKVLSDAGYDPGPLDGVDGEKTQAAVARYGEEKARVTSAQEGGADELIDEIYT